MGLYPYSESAKSRELLKAKKDAPEKEKLPNMRGKKKRENEAKGIFFKKRRRIKELENEVERLKNVIEAQDELIAIQEKHLELQEEWISAQEDINKGFAETFGMSYPEPDPELTVAMKKIRNRKSS